MENNINKLTNEELVKIIGGRVIGTPSGLDAQHAQAELYRRLVNAINSLNNNTITYSRKLTDLTILLFFMAFIQILVSLGAIAKSWKDWIILSAVILFLVYYFVKLVFEKKKIETK